MLRRTSRTNSS